MSATRYYVLAGSSNEADAPVTWRVAVASEGEIIAQAEEECRSTGEDLEFLAGFELIGTSKSSGGIGAEALTWSRDWMPGEKFKAALLKLGDEGRIYLTFAAADPVQVQAFLEQAASVGLRADAEALHSLTFGHATHPPLCKRGGPGGIKKTSTEDFTFSPPDPTNRPPRPHAARPPTDPSRSNEPPLTASGANAVLSSPPCRPSSASASCRRPTRRASGR